MVVPDILSEEEEEVVMPLFEQGQVDTDFDPDLSPDEHMDIGAASSFWASFAIPQISGLYGIHFGLTLFLWKKCHTLYSTL